MTTYSTSFVLEGKEVPIYRRMLESWASIVEGDTIDVVERLIHNTYDAEGNSLAKVEENLRLEIVYPFFRIMDEELERQKRTHEANIKLPFGQRNPEILIELMLLKQVVNKVKRTYMSSSHST